MPTERGQKQKSSLDGTIKGRSGEPLLGIFWLIGGRIVAFTTPAAEVETVAGFKDSEFAHVMAWAEVQRQHPELCGRDYWERPRGRVTYRLDTDTHQLLLPTRKSTNRGLVDKIVRRFHLTNEKLKVVSDRHYDPPTREMLD